ncbi:DMT family transporter [Amycolatopsis sp. NPDC050768]|uniref:DMT family transporter n=1 Tax=Amycolatopsis sp. NPDC050768 TaxID=3154839 RepID=UPI0033E050E8
MTTTELPSRPPVAGPITVLTDRVDPRLLAAAGSLCIALSSVFIKVSGASGSTSSFWRCLLSIPVLATLAFWEWRRTGVRPKILFPLLGGLGLGLDFVLWGESIPRVGAGIATVLLGVQVVIVPLLALLFLSERPGRRFLLTAPALLVGIVLSGGFLGKSAVGSDPLSGALLALAAGAGYSCYLLLIRLSSGPATQIRSLLLATVSAGVVAVALGVPTHRLDFTPGWPAFGWLVALALVGQVVGWLLIAAGLPRMTSATGSVLMLLQPIGAVVYGIVLLGEEPTVLQLAGCAVVVAAVCFAGRAPRGVSSPGTPAPPTRGSRRRAHAPRRDRTR